MNSKMKNGLLWVLAAIITIGLVIYQRSTGPSYPVRGEVEIGTETVNFALIRSFSGEDDAEVNVPVVDKSISGKMTYKRYKSYDKWVTVDMTRKGEDLSAFLPNQPPAGKIEYTVSLYKDGKEYLLNDEPAIIRYTGVVPRAILVPHIFFMFFSILFGLRAGLEALLKRKDAHYYSGVTLLFILVGGLILGPIVQKYAFDAYWTGWPFGTDLTDNKTLVMFVFWLIAWVRIKWLFTWLDFKKEENNRIWVRIKWLLTWGELKKEEISRVLVLIATVVMIGVYIIPHSAMGSEIDHRKQESSQVIKE